MSPRRLCWLLLALAPAAQLVAADTVAPANAGARPRIGLVLSGGGARGTAHIGVLKVLDELGIRIDAIAGTSMGAVVGGLYASGMSGRDIERVMASVDWADAFRDRPRRTDLNLRRKVEDQNFLVKLPLGLRAGNFLLPKGLVQGQKLNQFLRRLTLPVANIRDFDALPTRFRALATDLETGASVVLKDGDLAQAMRASMSAPGLFAPVEIGGRMLVDGGLSANLPVDVARSLDVDVLIVVDAGFPLQSRRQLQSVTSITNQMLAILIRQNSDVQRASLIASDIIINPALGDASSYDFSSLQRLVALGEAAAQGARDRLSAYRSDPASYADWVTARSRARQALPRIDFVTVASSARNYDDLLHANFDPFIDSVLNPDSLARAITQLYGQGNLESLDYRLDHDSQGAGLVFETQRNSWGPNYIRFGLSLQDDFAGNSTFNAAARFKLAELNRRGAEWIWDLQVGGSPHLSTEWFQPLDYRSRWFVMPHASFQVSDVPLVRNQQLLADYRLHTYEFGIDAGRQFDNWGELRTGLQRDYGFSRVRIGDPAQPENRFDVRELFVRFTIDRLDDFNFPRHGESLKLEWDGGRTALGSAVNANQVKADWLFARSVGRNTGVLWLSAGSNLDANPQVRTLFQLGGFLNLSGLSPNSISGAQFAIARGLYFRQIGRGGEGFLNVPTYLGASFELGNVWDNRRDISLGSAKRNGSVFLGLDTLLGPVYLGTGFNSQGNTAFYLFLGRTF